MTPRIFTDLRLATYRQNKRRRLAAAETAEVANQPQPAPTRVLRFAGHTTPIIVGAPTFSGTEVIEVAPGVKWSTPPDWTTYGSFNRTPNGIYVVEPGGRMHCLRENDRGQVEEIQLPAEVEAELRTGYHIE